MGKNKKLEKALTSDIELNIQLNPNEVKEVQRTAQWYKDRLGNFTGSGVKKLMGCSNGLHRLEWNNINRIFGFSDGAIKYAYEKAMERKKNRVIDNGDGSISMRYGTIIEPLISKAAKKQLKKIGNYKKIGFKTYPKMKRLGSSADKLLVDSKSNPVAVVEMKACVTWESHYERIFGGSDEKGMDFWQIQTEMLSWEVLSAYYVIAEPPISTSKYVFHDGDIMDLYKEWKKECKIDIIEVKASIIHQRAILMRSLIAERVIKTWMKKGGDFKEIFDNVIEMFHNDFEKLELYIPKELQLPKPKPIKKEDPNEMKHIRVAFPVAAENENNWKLMTESNEEETAWSTPIWIAKKPCSLKVSNDNKRVAVLAIPTYLYNQKFKK